MKGGSIALRGVAGPFLLFLLFMWAAGTPCVAADHTPMMFRADPWHSGINDDGGITPLDTLIWMNTTGDRIYSSPAVVDGVVYVGSDDHTVYAFDAVTGDGIWIYTTGGRVLASPAILDGTVFVGSYDKSLYALDKDTGSVLWSFPMAGWVTADPVVTSGVVYSGSLDGNLYAIDATTGRELWNASFGYYPSIDSSPCVAGGILYVAGGQRTLYALDAIDGSEVWNFTSGDFISSSTSVADGIVYFACYDRKVYALNATTGAQIWTFETGGGGEVHSSPAVAYGVVYIGSSDSNVYALDSLTGEKIWNFTTGNVVYSSPTYANGIVYVGSWDHDMYALDSLTGEKIWNYHTEAPIFSSPAVANGIVYFGSLDGNLYAVGHPPADIPVTNFTANETFGVIPMAVQFTDLSTGGGPLSYQWDFGDGTPNSTEQNPVHTYTAMGTYDVTLTASNAAGSDTLKKEWFISAFEPMPPVGGDKAYFLVHSNVEGAEVYFNGDWLMGTIENGTLLVQTCTTCTPVWTYTVQKCGYFPLTQQNSQSPGKDETVHLYANLTAPKEPLIADFTANVTEASAPPLIVQFESHCVGIAESFNWSFGDGTFSQERDPVHTYTNFGNYAVSLHVTNSACQENTMERVDFIQIMEKPPFYADFTVTPVIGSAPLTVRCTDQSHGNPSTIIYDFGDGSRKMGAKVAHTYRFPGTYTITETISKYDPATRSVVKSVAVKPDVIAVYSSRILPLFAGFSASPVTGTVPLTVKFTDESFGGPTFYIYDFGDGFKSMDQNPAHTYRFPGLYTVSQKVLRVGHGAMQSDVEVKQDLILVSA